MVKLVTALEQAHRESPSWRLYGLCHQAATSIAELEAENERLTKLLGDAQQALRNEIIAHGNTIRARTGAVKVPAEASKEMIDDGVLAYNLTGIAGGVINTAEDHVTFIWNAMAAHLSDLDPAVQEGKQPAVTESLELSGNTGELIDRMAAAIRDWGSHYDDGPWETLPEDRKAGWRGDAERALAVVKEYLTARRPSEQAVTEAMELARTVLARSITAGHNVPGPTPEDIEKAFWALDAALKAAMEAGR